LSPQFSIKKRQQLFRRFRIDRDNLPEDAGDIA
jgi:hypothetical protein